MATVALLLFIILLLSTPKKEEFELLGFSVMDVVTACAGFFLVVVFPHIDLRNNLGNNNIAYIEYYYFVTYIAILIPTVNALLLTKTKIPWLLYRDNLLFRLLYWPLTTSITLLITVYTFY